MLEELTGKRVLLVGYGSIGKEIERMLEPFRVELVRIARSARTSPIVHPVTELNTLLPHAQIVILILPHTPESHGLIGATQFALMQQGTLLVNAARGPIVDTTALVEALQSGHVRAAVDVTDPEPLPDHHPLFNHPRALITAHVATPPAPQSPHFAARVRQNLRRFISGEPLLSPVNLEAGY